MGAGHSPIEPIAGLLLLDQALKTVVVVNELRVSLKQKSEIIDEMFPTPRLIVKIKKGKTPK